MKLRMMPYRMHLRIREGMRKELPSWMLPEYWTFVKHIDKTSVGKFDKKDLRSHLAEGEYNIIRLKGPGESQRLDDLPQHFPPRD